MKRKRPGGQRQRLAAAAAEDAPAKMQSVLACYLLQRMAWGFYSPQEVQKLASMAKTDIENSQRSPDPMADLDKLASAKTYGRYPNKCNSDLMKRVGTVPFAKPLLIKMPLAGPAGSVNETLQSVFLPHEIFACIHEKYPDTWSRSILPDEGSLEAFWKAVDQHPSMTDEIRNKPNYRRRLIPFALHGDGVPITGRGKAWQQCFTDFSFYSLVGMGNTSELLFYLWGMFDKLRYLNQEIHSTLGCFYSLLRWSFQALFDGRWPSRDRLGNRWPVVSEACSLDFLLLYMCDSSHGFVVL